jgi:hypothetical protein
MERPRYFAPLMTAILLVLLPALYVISYLSLVVPEGRYTAADRNGWRTFIGHYHVAPAYAPKVFWPLEKLDQWLRPDAWPDPPIVHPPA